LGEADALRQFGGSYLPRSRDLIARFRPVAKLAGLYDLGVQLDQAEAYARWMEGDVAGAHARMAELDVPARLARYEPRHGGGTVEGRVVDARGALVAGATVAASDVIRIDSVGILYFLRPVETPTAITDLYGRFTLAHVLDRDTIVAFRGTERSRPVPASG